MSAKKTKHTSMLVWTMGLIMALFFVQAVTAQDTRGTIKGIVTDPNGAAVVGATVSVIDPSRAKTTNIVTNEDGFYQVPFLTAGKYQVVVESKGFKKTVNDNVLLQINEALQVNFKLEVGQPVETVTVTSEAPPLQTETASLGQVIDARRIEELPLVHGDPYTLMGLSPGTTYTGSTRLDRPFEPTHIIGYAIDGTRGNRSDLTIDGAPSTATANQNEVIASYVPPSDIVAEFKVQTATFDAQFGNTEGGVTSISIKSGANKPHGSIYYFGEPGTWAANDFFGNARGQARPTTKSDRFGGYISGPVILPYIYNGKNKTFFLFGYEGIRDSRPRFDAGSGVWVPTDAMKNGDLSGLGINIYDPLTAVVSGTSYNRTQFAGNIIPANRISPIAKAVMATLGAPKSSGLLGNIFDSTLTEKTKPYDNYTFRVDQNFGQTNHLFVRGSYYDRNSIYNDYTATPYSGVNFVFASRQGVIDDVHTFNATTFLNLRYGYNRFIRGQDQEEDARGYDLTTLGWSSTYNSLVPDAVRRFPRFDFPSPGTLSNGMSNEFRPVDTHSFAAILNKILDTHSLKLGSELRIYREDDNFKSNDQTGQFVFNNTYTRLNSATGTDLNGIQAFAAFLLGLPSTQQIVRRADYSEYSKTYSFFVQDDWKFNRKLSFNLGLRYEKETPMVERQNKSVSGFDFNYTQPLQGAARTKLTSSPVAAADGIAAIDPTTFNTRGALIFASSEHGGLYNTPNNTFLPRFGVAYQLNDKTVLRAGIGLFAGFLGERRGDVFQNGYTETTALNTTSLPNGAIIPQNISLFPTISIKEPVGNQRGAYTGLGTALTFFNQNPKSSKQARYQIGIQREFKYGFVAEATYVGNYGYDIEFARNINALPNQYLNTDAYLSPAMTSRNAALAQQVANPFVGMVDFLGNSFANATIARSQLLRPFPEFGDIITSVNDGKSWYNSGQFSLQKRFSQGYTVGMAYTWSKWLQATELLNPGDATPTKMISDFDSPHKFTMSTLLELPFGKGHLLFANANGIVDRAINGWQFGFVYSFQTGFPIAFGSFNANSGATTGDLFYNGGEVRIPADQRTTAAWFNTAPFGTATPVSHIRTLPYRFANVRRDNINNLDFSLKKDVRIHEQMKFQFKFELINALNEPYFPAPGSALGGTFGTISAASANQDNYARRAQFGLKFMF